MGSLKQIELIGGKARAAFFVAPLFIAQKKALEATRALNLN